MGPKNESRKKKNSRDGAAPLLITTIPPLPPAAVSSVMEADFNNRGVKFLENGSLRNASTPPTSSSGGGGGGGEDRRKQFHSLSQLLKRKKKSSLKIGKKLYEFYTAPIAKFWSYTIAYLIMMAMYIYIAMVATPERCATGGGC